MSQLRDIQKLRSTRQPLPPSQIKPRFIPLAHPQTSHHNRLLDLQTCKTSTHKFTQNQNKQKLPPSRDMRIYRKNSHNDPQLSQRRQHDIISSTLPISTSPLKISQRTSNTLTSRKQKPQELIDFQMMPQNDFNHHKKIQENLALSKTNQKLNKNCFLFLYPIGKGGFGKVWKVQYKKNNQILAMKQMHKAKIIQKKSINSVMYERTLLSKLKHPFIINMIAAFQDRQNLYLLMDYINGGDLRYHIGRKRKFTQKQTKFFIANMIIGLQYLHKNKIIHRDMKPQNMVFDSDGYLRITDLGISRQYRQDNHQDTSGTPGYMSPEVICRKNHSYAADYFAVGVMGYQFMMGKRPYIGKNRKQIRDQILSKQVMIKLQQLPQKWSPQSADFINKLLIRNPNNRIGCNGIQQIKSHQWLANVDWKKLTRKQIQAPYIPLSIQQNYQQYRDQISSDSVDEHLQENLLMLRDKQVRALFQDYYFQRLQSQHKKSLSHTTAHSTHSYTSSTFS